MRVSAPPKLGPMKIMPRGVQEPFGRSHVPFRTKVTTQPPPVICSLAMSWCLVALQERVVHTLDAGISRNPATFKAVLFMRSTRMRGMS